MAEEEGRGGPKHSHTSLCLVGGNPRRRTKRERERGTYGQEGENLLLFKGLVVGISGICKPSLDFDVDDPPARSRRNKNRLILVAAFPYKGGLCSARSPLYDLSWAATERGVCGYRGPESLTYRNNGHFAPHSTNSPKAKTGSLNLGERGSVSLSLRVAPTQHH